jgi:uncharacterized protein YgfB (UPF0149 family)
MESLDKLAEWLKASDSLGGVFNEETDSLKTESRQALADLEEAIQAATAQQVAEDEIAFLEAIEPVKTGLRRLKTSLTAWEEFLQRIEPRV